MPRKIKLVVFDLDGTLMDAYKAVYRSINYTMKRMGFAPIDHETIKRTVGHGDRHLLQQFVGKERTDEFLSIYRTHHKDSLKQGTKLLPGAKKLLNFLKKDQYRVAVASNRPTRFSHIAIKHLNIRDYFHCILCGDRVSRPKPSPVILQEILKKFKLTPKEALYVGDMTIDVQTGQRAGIETVAVVTGSSSHAELARLKPGYIIPNVYDVAGILKNLNGAKM